MSVGSKSRHRGQILSMSWKTSLKASTRLAVGPGSRMRLKQLLGQIGAGRRVLLLFQTSIALKWMAELQDSLSADHDIYSYELAEGEACKSTDSLMQIWSVLQQQHFDRHDTVVAIGGGAITDVAGFAASTYLRGIKLLLMPTTLLAQVDAAIGGKTAVNLAAGKNLAGTFYFPDAVIVDPEFLLTLPDRQFKSGLGEIIKYALIEDTVAANSDYKGGPRTLLSALQDHVPEGHHDETVTGVITSCVKMKLAVVGADSHESGLRRCLNLGHTLGHALEKVSNYAISHGEAVAIGCMFVMRLAVKRKMIDAAAEKSLTDLLTAAALPMEIPDDLDRGALRQAMLHDKKRQGDFVRLVLPHEHLGQVDFDVQVPLKELEQLL